MGYEYESKINEAFFKAGRDGRNVNNELLAELQEVYRKAKAFDEISKYVNRKLSVEVPLDDDYLIGRIESYETIQDFMGDE